MDPGFKNHTLMMRWTTEKSFNFHRFSTKDGRNVAPRIDVKKFVPCDGSGAAAVGLSAFTLTALLPSTSTFSRTPIILLQKLRVRKEGLKACTSLLLCIFYKIKMRFPPMATIIPIP